MSKGTTNRPDLDALHASGLESECELFGGGSCGDHIIDHGDMAIEYWVQSKSLAQIFLSLLLVQPRLSRCGAYALQAVAIHGNVLEPTNGMGAWWQAYQEASAADKALMIENFGSESGIPKRRRRERNKDAKSRELDQLRELSLRNDEVIATRPEPLFVVPGAEAVVKDAAKSLKVAQLEPTKPVPVFDPVQFSEADFAKLLANDEPYIPPSRHRKRKPSSSLSIIEREAGLSESDVAAQDDDLFSQESTTPKRRQAKQSKPAASNKRTQATKPSSKAKANQSTANSNAPVVADDAADKPKRRRRKSNTKPKADE